MRHFADLWILNCDSLTEIGFDTLLYLNSIDVHAVEIATLVNMYVMRFSVFYDYGSAGVFCRTRKPDDTRHTTSDMKMVRFDWVALMHDSRENSRKNRNTWDDSSSQQILLGSSAPSCFSLIQHAGRRTDFYGVYRVTRG